LAQRPFHGWRLVAAGAGIQFLQSSLLLQSFGAYVAVLQEDRGWSKTELSFAAALHQMEAAILGPFLGWLVDRFGPHGVIRAGVVALGAGFMRPLAQKGETEEALVMADWAPLVDVEETDKEFLIKAELPEIHKEDVKVTIEEGVRRAGVNEDGSFEFPSGLPYCLRDGLVYASGTTRCADCRNGLTVSCPMCGLGRDASITTCGNCGLVLKVESRTRVMRPAGPPPGGAALA